MRTDAIVCLEAGSIFVCHAFPRPTFCAMSSGPSLPRAYSWSAELVPTRCRASRALAAPEFLCPKAHHQGIWGICMYVIINSLAVPSYLYLRKICSMQIQIFQMASSAEAGTFLPHLCPPRSTARRHSAARRSAAAAAGSREVVASATCGSAGWWFLWQVLPTQWIWKRPGSKHQSLRGSSAYYAEISKQRFI